MYSNAHITEPIAAPEHVVCGISSIEHIGGGVFRFVFYSQKDGENPDEVTLITHADNVPSAILKMAKAVGIQIIAEMPRNFSQH